MHFSGTHPYSIDAKGRIAIPARFREQILRNDSDQVQIVSSIDEPCLQVIPQSAWERLQARINEIRNPVQRKAFARGIISEAHQVGLDNQGRVLVPGRLREFAGLENDVLVVGVNDRIQLWSPRNWDAAREDALEIMRESDALLADLGF